MDCLPSRLISISLLLLLLLILQSATSEHDGIKRSLIAFLDTLSGHTDVDFLGWNNSTDPCDGPWRGVACNNRTHSVRSIVLEDFALDGSIDARLLCDDGQSLVVLSLANNSLSGQLPPEIKNCSQLTHLYLGGNRLSGTLPSSISSLKNLKRLDVSNNNFSGALPPDLSGISGLVSFNAQNNRLRGSIPQFDFANLKQFNVSNNLLNGSIPRGGDRFDLSSFSGNPGLCGKPLPIACPPASPPESTSKNRGSEQAIMYSGYIVLGLVFILFVTYMVIKRRKKDTEDINDEVDKRKERKKKMKQKQSTTSTSEANVKITSGSSDRKTAGSRSEYSIASSSESAMMSTSLVVMKNPTTEELRFEDLLKAPAELVARGRLGSLYKVLFENEITLAVKRIKDYTVSPSEFRRRMEQMDRLNHPNMLPPLAFYCSKQEKLVVYEFQKNGSLFKLIQGSQEGQSFDWTGRLAVAAGIADGMSFLHGELGGEGYCHGNLKSSNILMDNSMEPLISEYGLMDISKLRSPELINASDRPRPADQGGLKADVYSFGIILLELLTGKLVRNNGVSDLPAWVLSVVREEWTAEVFDKALVADGASEERMVHLLQVALKCVDSASGDRPTMVDVAKMISAIREDDERSSIYEA